MIRRTRLSITARLSLAFGAVSVLLSGGIGAYLYRALDERLVQRHTMPGLIRVNAGLVGFVGRADENVVATNPSV